MQLAVSAHERLLCDVFSVVGVARDEPGRAKRDLLIPLDERPEGGVVASGGRCDGGSVIGVRDVHALMLHRVQRWFQLMSVYGRYTIHAVRRRRFEIRDVHIEEHILDKIESKHGVAFEEVQEACQSGSRHVRRVRERRYLVLARTESGRLLAIRET